MPDYVYDSENGKHPPRPSWLPTEGPGNMNIPPEKWGMTIKQFCAFITWCKCCPPWQELEEEENNFGKTKGYVNLYQVCDRYVKPYTRGLGNSIALLLNNKEPIQAQIMISHAWGECLLETMAALLGKASVLGISLDTAIWFCTFAQYQPGDLPGDCGPGVAEQLALDPFKRVIESQPRYGMLVIHTSRVELYTRLWCVFEVNEAEASDVVASAAASMSYLLKMAGGRRLDEDNAEDVELGSSISNEALQCDSQNAGCWSKDDALMIREKVEAQGGFGKLDEKIFRFRKATMVRMWGSMKRFGDWMSSLENPKANNLSDNKVLNLLQFAIMCAANYVGLGCLTRLWIDAGMDDSELLRLSSAAPEILMSMEAIFLEHLDPSAANPPPGLDKDKYKFKGNAGHAWDAGTEEASSAFLDFADLKSYPLAIGLLEMAQGGNTLGALVSSLDIGSKITAKVVLNKVDHLFNFEKKAKELEKAVAEQLALAAEKGLDTSNLPEPHTYWRTPDGTTYTQETIDKLIEKIGELCFAANAQNDNEAEKAAEPLKPIHCFLEWALPGVPDADALTESSKDKIKAIFQAWDSDKSGAIGREELSAVLTELEPAFTDHDVGLMFTIADVNQDGQIDYNEFVEWLFGTSGGLGRGQGSALHGLA